MPFAFLLIFLEVINFENAYYQYNYTFARGGDYRRSYRQRACPTRKISLFRLFIDSNFRVNWLLFLRQRVKKAEEPLKSGHNFISRCSKVDYRKPKGSGYG